MGDEITVVARGETLDSVVIRLDIADRELLAELERSALRAEIARVIAQHLACRARSPGPGLRPIKLERVRVFIERSIAEPLRIEHLAASVHMSPFHFSRLFKLATGESPHAYLTRRRVERAKELLTDASLPLVHVASAVGFQTQGHFTEVFRRHTGTTPRRFRLAASSPPEPKAPTPLLMED
jgi:transcriptional regulator GlxA family with amidase domain